MRLALYEPDIPQNTGTMLRTAVCLGIEVDVIEPCGFLLGDRQLRRAGLDYLDRAILRTYPSWTAYLRAREQARSSPRLVLLTTRAEACYTAFRFRRDDVIMVGRETCGVPEAVHAAADGRLRVPMVGGGRSLNVAVAAAMVMGEALRQTSSGAVSVPA